MAEAFRVPFQASDSEFVEKRSRFISHLLPVESEEDARAFIAQVKKQYYDARHNCWCYLIGENIVRYSDDGEPQGTAGQPMLNVFQREGVTNVVCVVTRYFGGILLGAGGLTRAYSKGARDALCAAGYAVMGQWAVVSIPLHLRHAGACEAGGGGAGRHGGRHRVRRRYPADGVPAGGAGGRLAGAADGAIGGEYRRDRVLGGIPSRPAAGDLSIPRRLTGRGQGILTECSQVIPCAAA